MIKKIYFLGDYYRGEQDQNIKALYSLISPIFYDTGIECKAIYFQQKYSDKEFYVKTLQGFGESIFKNFNLDQSTAVIGFELNPIDIEFLKKYNIKWLNFEIHPIRFLKDLCFNISASFELDLELLKISPQEIKMLASTTKAKLELKNLDLSFNSLLILGQTPIDKSIFFDGKFKNLLDYLHDIHILSKNFDHVYYRPHPYLTDPKVDKILQEELKVEILDNQYNFYHLMSLEQIKGVCGISSSSLYEAKFFDKEVVFLEPRVRSFSVPVFLSDFLNGYQLWLRKLLGFDLTLTEFKFDLIDNTCRELYCYWSYKTPFQDLSNSIYNLSLKTLETEQYAHDVEKRAIEAESRAIQAESRAIQAESRAIQAEQKALEAQAIHAEYRAIEAETRAIEAETRAQEANERVLYLEQKVNEIEVRAENVKQYYNMVINSRSWKFTKPLRYMGKFVRWFARGSYHWLTFSPTSRPRRVLKKILIQSKFFINNRPKLKIKITSILNHFPSLKSRLGNVGSFSVYNINSSQVQVPAESSNLTPNAQIIYNKLKMIIETNKNEMHP